CACSPFAVAFLFFRFPPAPSLFPYTTLFRFPSRSRFLRYIRRFVALHFWHSLIPVRLESGHNRGLCYRNYRRIQRLSNRESKPLRFHLGASSLRPGQSRIMEQNHVKTPGVYQLLIPRPWSHPTRKFHN